MLKSGSPFNKGLVHYTSHKHHGKCHMCATCASLYIRKRHNSHSLRDDPDSVIECTENGVFLTPRPYSDEAMSRKNKVLAEKLSRVVNTTLLYGAALYHTERELDLSRHMDTQIQLLTEAYSILTRGIFRISEKLSSVQKEELILYIELTHPVEKAATSDGHKITHPHVWIRTNLKSYGPPYTTIPYLMDDSSVVNFISETVKRGTSVLESRPSSKVYAKYYLDSNTYQIKRCEIDIEGM